MDVEFVKPIVLEGQRNEIPCPRKGGIKIDFVHVEPAYIVTNLGFASLLRFALVRGEHDLLDDVLIFPHVRM